MKSVVKAWADVGIRDSKNISSDKRIRELAELIRKTPGCVTTVVPIGNEAYNRLYAKMKSVNAMLAWGHARVIENLMGQRHRMTPPPVRAISDQFAVEQGNGGQGADDVGPRDRAGRRSTAPRRTWPWPPPPSWRGTNSSPAWGRWKSSSAWNFPKGASAAVDAAAKEFAAKHGPEGLAKVAKMHFRTALRAQGLPEPPKVEWRRRSAS